MSRYIGPKIRLSRHLGFDLGHKQNIQKVAKRLSFPPGQHGRRGAKRDQEFGKQLKEKQKIRFMYGVTERQLKRYIAIAQRNPQATGAEFLKLLERRLDNVVYRLGLVPTRPAARQLISHGHIFINNRKIDIPSYSVKIDDIVTISSTALKIPDVKSKISDKEYQPPKWMQKTAAAGKIKRLPEKQDIETAIDEQLIVEYYSR